MNTSNITTFQDWSFYVGCHLQNSHLQKWRAKELYGEIKEIFSYDLNNDIASVQPEFICNMCR